MLPTKRTGPGQPHSNLVLTRWMWTVGTWGLCVSVKSNGTDSGSGDSAVSVAETTVSPTSVPQWRLQGAPIGTFNDMDLSTGSDDDEGGFDTGSELNNMTAMMSSTDNATEMMSFAEIARSTMRQRRVRAAPVGPADALSAVTMLETYRTGMHRIKTNVMVEDYLETVANFTGEFMAWGCDQSQLDAPVVATLEDSLRNATATLIELGTEGSHTYESMWSKVVVEVKPRGNSISYSGGFGASFMIPSSTLLGTQNLVGASFTEYADTRLFLADVNTSEEQVGSTIMAVEVTDTISGVVTGTFDFTLNLNTSLMTSTTYSPRCAFFVEPANGSLLGSWSSTGCSTSVVNGSHATCTCTHLTSFAVLVSSNSGSTSSENARALSIITYVGVAISLGGVVLTLVTILSVERLRKQLRYQILMNLATAIGLALVFFSLLTLPKTTEGCEAVSFGALYFFVASLLWHVVDAYDLYQTFCVVFNDAQARSGYYMSRFRGVAWGFAMFPPAMAFAIDRANFITTVTTSTGEAPSLCWINMASPTRWAFLGPVVVVVIVNLAATGHIVAEIQKHTEHETFAAALHTARIVATVATATGLSWLFAVMVVLTSEEAFSFLFAIFASTQGATIFYFHVVQNALSRKAWRETFSRLSRGGSTTSSVRSSGRKNPRGRYTAAVSTSDSTPMSTVSRRQPAWKAANSSVSVSDDPHGESTTIIDGFFLYNDPSASTLRRSTIRMSVLRPSLSRNGGQDDLLDVEPLVEIPDLVIDRGGEGTVASTLRSTRLQRRGPCAALPGGASAGSTECLVRTMTQESEV